MNILVKVLIICLAIVTIGAVLICFPQSIPAGIVALIVGAVGLCFSPIIAMAINEMK